MSAYQCIFLGDEIAGQICSYFKTNTNFKVFDKTLAGAPTTATCNDFGNWNWNNYDPDIQNAIVYVISTGSYNVNKYYSASYGTILRKIYSTWSHNIPGAVANDTWTSPQLNYNTRVIWIMPGYYNARATTLEWYSPAAAAVDIKSAPIYGAGYGGWTAGYTGKACWDYAAFSRMWVPASFLPEPGTALSSVPYGSKNFTSDSNIIGNIYTAAQITTFPYSNPFSPAMWTLLGSKGYTGVKVSAIVTGTYDTTLVNAGGAAWQALRSFLTKLATNPTTQNYTVLQIYNAFVNQETNARMGAKAPQQMGEVIDYTEYKSRQKFRQYIQDDGKTLTTAGVAQLSSVIITLAENFSYTGGQNYNGVSGHCSYQDFIAKVGNIQIG